MRYLSTANAASIFSSPLQDVQPRFLRLLFGANISHSRWVLHRNACLPPVQSGFLQSAARLWSSLKADPNFLMQALHNDIALYKCGYDMAWASHLIKQGHQIGMFPDIDRRELHTLTLDSLLGRSFHVPTVGKRLDEHYEALWNTEVHGSPYVEHSESSTGSALRFDSFIYEQGKEGHLTYHGPSHLVTTLHSFRIGAAGLKAGCRSHNLEDRQCPHCRDGTLEDERHVIQHCPAYSTLRSADEFAPLFWDLLQEGSLHAFFNDTNQHLLARFLYRCLRMRVELLQALVP